MTLARNHQVGRSEMRLTLTIMRLTLTAMRLTLTVMRLTLTVPDPIRKGDSNET